MNRREAVQIVTLAVGALLSHGAAPRLAAQAEASEAAAAALLAEVADVILPDTDTPGAKAAGVEKFILRVVRDCFKAEERQKFFSALETLDGDSRKQFSKPFTALSEAEKVELVKFTAAQRKPFFSSLRQLVVTAYFNSEIGATQALAYLPIPGRFQGSVPLAPGQKAWAL
jgi:hypothetical protein